MWQFYEEASSYGKEVYTRSGRRGAALAYYWPMLSAVRLLGPALEPDRLGFSLAIYMGVEN